MQMMRTFNAVGQGAFYTECFEGGCNIVYDCGTLSDIRHLEKEIDNQFHNGETIEAVFISHLHTDHCNGLDYLLDKCCVKKIFVPFLNSTEKALALLEVGLQEGYRSFLWEFIEDAKRVVRRKGKETEIVYVYPEEQEYEEEEFFDRVIILDSVTDKIESGTQIAIARQCHWIFTPFHYNESWQTEQLKAALTKAGIAIPENGEEVKKLLEDTNTKSKLRKIYDNEVDGGHNGHSIVLYSGPANIVSESDTWAYRWTPQYNCPSVCFCECYEELESGCLYTGDYQAKEVHRWKALWKFVKPYLCRIGCCQLPHHGSAGNYNKGFQQICDEFVISCGHNNSYHHPDTTVIRDLLFANKVVSIATEASGVRVTYVIDGFDRW